jgi:3-dehydroquinate dehydratase
MQLLKPQLVCLVSDDEQHFIVRRAAVLFALQLLRMQQRIKLQIIVVMHAVARRRVFIIVHTGAYKSESIRVKNPISKIVLLTLAFR